MTRMRISQASRYFLLAMMGLNTGFAIGFAMIHDPMAWFNGFVAAVIAYALLFVFDGRQK